MSEHVIGGPLHVCETCPTKHYDNCPTCWGFGVRAHLGVTQKMEDGEPVPLSAGDAAAVHCVYGAWAPCPTCKSTPRGISDA